MRKLLALAIMVLFILAASPCWPDIPHLINYQGMLTDDEGNPLNGPFDLTFRIFNVDSGGTSLWGETQSNVPVENGLFSVILGSEDSLDLPFDEDYWLEIEVEIYGGLSPRMKLTSVGYAYRAEWADTTDHCLTALRADTADYALAADTADYAISSTPGGSAGGDLTGTYPDPTIATDAVTSGKILDGTIGRADVELTFKAPYADTADYALVAAAGPADNDWLFRITDTADTTITTGGSWGIARYGNILYGNADSTHVNLGVACTTGLSGQDRKYCTIGGGVRNIASGQEGTVGGGSYNTASGYQGTVAGGYAGNASGESSTIGGGWHNTASGIVATVAGGQENTASLIYATVGGGLSNSASGGYATVGGGTGNTASDYTTVGGGVGNTASGSGATVGGGKWNKASGYYAAIPAGYADTAAGDFSLAAGDSVRITSDADFTFAFGRNFTTATPNAVIFSHPSAATRMGINLTNPTYAITLPNNADNSGQGMANAWNTYSSIRWKENISQIDDALDKILALRGVYFDWKQGNERDVGLIAEEVGKVIPELVSYEENGVDAEGLDYARLTALLVEAMKEQQKEIELLKKKINRLEKGSR